METEHKIIENYKEAIIKMVNESKDLKLLNKIYTFIVHIRPKEG